MKIAVFLVLYLYVPAERGRIMPQYIPMADMAECVALAPMIEADAGRLYAFTRSEPTGQMAQKPGEEMRPKMKDVRRTSRGITAFAECREFHHSWEATP